MDCYTAGRSSRAVRQSLRAREGECFNYCRDRVLGVGVQVRELKDVNDIRRAWRAAVHTAATTGAGKTGLEINAASPEDEAALDASADVGNLMDIEVKRHGGKLEKDHEATRHRLYFAPLKFLGGVLSQAAANDEGPARQINACHDTAHSLVHAFGKAGTGTSEMEDERKLASGQDAIQLAMDVLSDTDKRYMIHIMVGLGGRKEGHSFTLVTGPETIETLESWAGAGEAHSLAKQIAHGGNVHARADACQAAKEVLSMAEGTKAALNGDHNITKEPYDGFAWGRILVT